MNKYYTLKIIILTFFFLISIFSLSVILIKKNFNIKHSVTRSILDNLDYDTLSFFKKFFYVHEYKNYKKNIDNDYNVKFLPETQSININFKKIKIYSLLDPTYRDGWKLKIEQFEDNIFLIHPNGQISYFKNDELLNVSKDAIKDKKIKTNLNQFDFIKILDGIIHNQKIYISVLANKVSSNFITSQQHLRKNEKCEQFIILVADLNFEYIKFKEFYDFKHICNDDENNMFGGVLSIYRHNESEGLIFSTFNQADGAGENSYLDRINNKNLPEQSDETIYGKIVFIDFKKKDLIIFSKGHRNIIGIHTDNDVILVTENGPRGGDEINKIEFGKNYGWPIASYGETYGAHNNEYNYAKSHSSYGFKEPIYSFVPSLGISEIIKLPNKFSKDWNNNYLIGTLADGHLMRVKFDNEFDKLLFNEKIFIGDRIRDIEYIHELNIILLSYDTGTLGFFKQIPHP